MDCKKTGSLIAKVRKEKNMTQMELARKLNISDKAVSKWERGLGCPDVTLLNELAEVLGINVKDILSGEMVSNDVDGGNMKRTKFYVCQDCGNVISSSSEMSLSCCGKNLKELIPNKEKNVEHELIVETVDNEFYVYMDHDMTKEHYISFIAYVTSDKLYINKLYPEQNAEVRFKKCGHGIIYAYCNQHGLLRKLI